MWIISAFCSAQRRQTEQQVTLKQKWSNVFNFFWHLTDRTTNRLIQKMIDCGSTFYPSNRSNSCDRKIKTSWNQCTVCSSVMKLVVQVDDSNLLHLYGSKECQTVNSETSHWAQPTSAHLQHLCLCRKKINIYCQISAVIVVGSVIWLTDDKSVWFLSEIRGAMMLFYSLVCCRLHYTTLHVRSQQKPNIKSSKTNCICASFNTRATCWQWAPANPLFVPSY